jgi:hypothetical protein
MTHDKNWLPTVVDSVLGAIPVAGATTQNAFTAWSNKNISVAREVLLSNIRAGDISAVHEDEFFSMLARFSRSVQEGVAKNNLILLARLITGICHADKEKSKAETFNQYADMLENLTWSEIVFLSRCIKSGEVINGTPEIKQILQQKGFFVYNLDPRVYNKEGVSNQQKSSLEATIMSLYPRYDLYQLSNNFSLGHMDIFGNPIAHKNDKNLPYGVDIEIQYEFSTKFNEFLNKYGNLWEDLSK